MMPIGGPQGAKNYRYDSRQIMPGDTFICLPGGERFVDDARQRGAADVLYMDREKLGVFANQLYNTPSRRIPVIGVTGTNGKTTVTHLIAAGLTAAGYRPAVLGTLNAPLTTPESLYVAEKMAEHIQAGGTHFVMEVSSHAIAQNRISGIYFAVKVLTNITQDHLDYHKTFEAYRDIKLGFMASGNGVALYPDLSQSTTPPFGHLLEDRESTKVGSSTATLAKLGSSRASEPQVSAAHLELSHHAQSQGLLPEDTPRLDVAKPDPTSAAGASWAANHGNLRASEPQVSAALEKNISPLGGQRGDIDHEYHHIQVPFPVPLPGTFNYHNFQAAIAVLRALGISDTAFVPGLCTATAPPGRFEAIQVGQPFLVIVDYAHTPDGLENVLIESRRLADVRGGVVRVLFGCGGDRDRGKRPKMAAIAAQYASDIVVTADNPRTENPDQIFSDILSGFPVECSYRVIPDRRDAICAILANATHPDVILLAGKGHETGQIFADKTLPFDDRTVAREWLVQHAAIKKSDRQPSYE